jgi:hypothetical protein
VDQFVESSGISPMNHLKGTVTILAVGSVVQGGNTTISGYTIVEAESLEASLAMVKTCPFYT